MNNINSAYTSSIIGVTTAWEVLVAFVLVTVRSCFVVSECPPSRWRSSGMEGIQLKVKNANMFFTQWAWHLIRSASPMERLPWDRNRIPSATAPCHTECSWNQDSASWFHESQPFRASSGTCVRVLVFECWCSRISWMSDTIGTWVLLSWWQEKVWCH